MVLRKHSMYTLIFFFLAIRLFVLGGLFEKKHRRFKSSNCCSYCFKIDFYGHVLATCPRHGHVILRGPQIVLYSDKTRIFQWRSAETLAAQIRPHAVP